MECRCEEFRTGGEDYAHDIREWHLIDDRFDIERSKTMMSKMVRKSIEGGRKGLRSVGDMNPFFSTGMMQELVAWESSLEKQFELPVTSRCTYI